MRVPSAHALIARVYTDCTGGLQYYTCVSSGFAGCCAVDACDYDDGCPDDAQPTTTSAAGTSTLSTVQTPTATTITAVARTSTSTSTSTSTTPQSSTQSLRATSSVATTPSVLSSAAKPTASTTSTASATASAATSLASASPSLTSDTTQATPSHLSGGALAGIILGSVLGAVLLLLAALVLWKRRRHRRHDLSDPKKMSASQQGAVQAPLLVASQDEKSGRVVSELQGTPVTPELSTGLFEDGSYRGFAVSPISPASPDSRLSQQPRQYNGQTLGPDGPRATLQLREQELSRGLHVASWGEYQP